MVKEIPLSRGYVALVDDEDYEYLMQWKWYARVGEKGSSPYATRMQCVPGGDAYAVHMHRVIIGVSGELKPDHINGNTLDNRRCNLRVATHQQNMWNRKSVTGSSSKYKGVFFDKKTGYYRTHIKINEKQTHIGSFWEEDDAARAYNKVAKAIHGEFAKLNPVPDGDCPSQIFRKNSYSKYRAVDFLINEYASSGK